jgi:replicative DNA helicase
LCLGEAQQAIDLVTLTDRLHRSGELDASGGAAYLAQLLDGVPRISNVDHYARIVKEKSVLRGLIHATEAIQQQALEAGEDADAILDRAESMIFELAEERVRTGLIGVKRPGPRKLAAPRPKIFSEGRRITGLSRPATTELDNRNRRPATLRIDHSSPPALPWGKRRWR